MIFNKFLRLIILLPVVLGFHKPGYSAEFDPRHISVICNSSQEANQIFCDYRVSQSVKIDNVGARVSGKAVQLSAESFAQFPAANQSTAILFLVDTSDPARTNTIERRIVSDLFNILSSTSGSKPHLKYGLATFDTDLRVISPFGSSHADTVNALAKIQANGLATEFYKSILDAISLLNSVEATRKALVILSDGKDEDRAYKHDDVIKAASDSKVVIMGLGYAEKKSDYPHLQTLKRLSDETFGLYLNVSEKSTFATLLDAPFSFVEKGSRITIPVDGYFGNEIITLDFGLSDGKKISLDTKVNISDKRPKIEVAWILIKKYWFYISLLFTASFIAGYFVYRVVKKLSLNKSINKNYAYLQEQNSSESKYFINKTAVRIGRNKDNDFCLINDSISSHHAELHMKRDGSFFIVDLNSTNGVLVNGIKVGQQELKDQDLIELGEVRLTFNRN
jgi:hypothetical protein